MNKYKWLIVSLPIDLLELSEILYKNKFNENSKQGFILSKASKSEVSGKFIDKKLSIKEVYNPFGEPIEVSNTDYIVTEFKFCIIESQNFILLELKNQPRTLKPFINFLNKTVGFGLTLREFKFNPIDVIEKIEDGFGKLLIQKIDIAELNIENKATANIQMNSVEDVRGILSSKMFQNKRFSIKSAYASFINAEYSGGKFSLNSNSAITLKHIPERIFLKGFIQILLNTQNY